MTDKFEAIVRRQIQRMRNAIIDIQKPEPDTPLDRAQVEVEIDYLKATIKSLPFVIDQAKDDKSYAVLRKPEQELFNSYVTTIAEKELLLAERDRAKRVKSPIKKILYPAEERKKFKRPRLEMRTFDGHLENWIEFYHWFTKHIHNNMDISNSVKMCFLQDALVGEPAELIDGFSIANTSSYKQAWDILNQTYNNKDNIIHRYLDLIIEYSALGDDADSSIKDFARKIVIYIRQLKAMDWDSESVKLLVATILTQKMKEETEEGRQQIYQQRKTNAMGELVAYLDRKPC
uniref:Uncharacterized protein n=1 Tax=Bracon brevicornis TaxID=1563983 RepID=A0A6V7IQ82_9HYME